MRTTIVAATLVLLLGGIGQVQAEPLDLFPDEPALGEGFIRLGCWNLRHINLEGDATDYLIGTTKEDDFKILTDTFAKAIADLGLDIVAISEHRRKSGDPNRLHQIRDALNGMGEGSWNAHETAIAYDSGVSNLQLAMLWNAERVTIDPTEAVLLSELRQPRDPETGELTDANMRAPWLVPVTSGALSFDVVVVHLKSGGETPQSAEVSALEQYIVGRHAAGDGHLVLCGDWNIRPDTAQGRRRLQQLEAHTDSGQLMHILTVEWTPLTLAEWDDLDDRDLLLKTDPVAKLLPFTHYNDASVAIDTFLDHVAVSKGLREILDDPIEVTLASGETDVRPGFRIPIPTLPEEQFHHLTDHLPVVMTLRTEAGVSPGPSPTGGLRVVAAIPNPVGVDSEGEAVWLHNTGSTSVSLEGWRIADDDNGSWLLTQAEDGTVEPDEIVRVDRRGRPMHLTNTGDTILLVDPNGATGDVESYGEVTSGEIVNFE